MGIAIRWNAGLACGLAVLLAAAACYGGEAKSFVPAGVPAPILDAAPSHPRELFSFDLKKPDGKPVKLSAWRGHPLLVDFWATWCPPCREEVPELNTIYRKYRSKGLLVVGISVDAIQGDGAKSVRRFAKRFKIKYPLVMADAALVDALDISNLPTTLFYDRKGKLLSRVEGAGRPGDLTDTAKKLFHER